MSNEVLDHVQSDLIPALRMPATVIDQMSARSFGDALVILRLGNLRIQVTRDKLKMRVEVGTMDHPHVMFGHKVLAQFFGLEDTPNLFGASTLTESMRKIAMFLNEHEKTLATIFSADNFWNTKQSLEAMENARVATHFGQQDKDRS